LAPNEPVVPAPDTNEKWREFDGMYGGKGKLKYSEKALLTTTLSNSYST
jgi:hypothetical protein